MRNNKKKKIGKRSYESHFTYNNFILWSHISDNGCFCLSARSTMCSKCLLSVHSISPWR